MRHQRVHLGRFLLACALVSAAAPLSAAAASAAPGGVVPAPPSIAVEAPGVVVTGGYSTLPLALTDPTTAAGGSDQSLEVVLLFETPSAPLSPSDFSLQERSADGSVTDVTTAPGDSGSVTQDASVVTALLPVTLSAGQTETLTLQEKLPASSVATAQYLDAALFDLDSAGNRTRIVAEDQHYATVAAAGVPAVGLDGRNVIDPGSIARRGDLGVVNGDQARGMTTVGVSITAQGQQLVPADYDFRRVMTDSSGATTTQPVSFASDGQGGLTAILETVDLDANYTERTPYLLGVAAGAPSSVLITTSLTPVGAVTSLASAAQYTSSFGLHASESVPAQLSAGGSPVTSVVSVSSPPTDDYADLRLRVEVTPPAGTRADQLSLALTEPDGSQTPLLVTDLGGGVLRGETETAWTSPLPGRTLRQLPLAIGLSADAPAGQLSVVSALVQQPSGVELTRTAAVATSVITRPSAPAAPVLTVGPGAITVTGMAPVSDGGSAVTGYVLTAVQAGVTRVVTVSTPSAQLSGLRDDQPVSVTVAAVNGVGSSLPSPSSTATPGLLPSSLSLRSTAGTVTAGGYLTLTGRLTRTVDAGARPGVRVTVNEVRRDGRHLVLGSAITGADGSYAFKVRPDGDALFTVMGLGVTASPARVSVVPGVSRLTHRRQRDARILVTAVITTESAVSPVFDVVVKRGRKVVVIASVTGKRLRNKGLPAYSVRLLLRRPARGVQVAFRIRATNLTTAVTTRSTAL